MIVGDSFQLGFKESDGGCRVADASGVETDDVELRSQDTLIVWPETEGIGYSRTTRTSRIEQDRTTIRGVIGGDICRYTN